MFIKQKKYRCSKGVIYYWVNELLKERKTLVFLPGLTADHRLFEKQVDYFESRYNIIVWDAPGHGASRPFTLSFSLEDKARWLHEILCAEGVEHPILVGQSMGGYVAQMYMQLYPHTVDAFVSIDSAPLQRQYLSGFEIWCLKHVENMYRWYPWKSLKSAGARGCAVSEYGRQLMYTMLSDYTHGEYASLAAHGYRILAEAIEQNLPYEIDCPAMLICGERDMAGSAKRYNIEWTKRTGIPLVWVPNAGHNANTDQPELVNTLIEKMLLKRAACSLDEHLKEHQRTKLKHDKESHF